MSDLEDVKEELEKSEFETSEIEPFGLPRSKEKGVYAGKEYEPGISLDVKTYLRESGALKRLWLPLGVAIYSFIKIFILILICVANFRPGPGRITLSYMILDLVMLGLGIYLGYAGSTARVGNKRINLYPVTSARFYSVALISGIGAIKNFIFFLWVVIGPLSLSSPVSAFNVYQTIITYLFIYSLDGGMGLLQLTEISYLYLISKNAVVVRFLGKYYSEGTKMRNNTLGV